MILWSCVYVFRRAVDGTQLPSEPGTYRRITELWKKYHLKTQWQRFWAECACPICGKVSMVGRNHTVLDDGTVSPSYVCPFPPCPFHEFVRLDAWSGLRC